MGGVVVLGAGARALEPDLLRFVREDQAHLRADPSRMARPLRVVVPSNALRTHLAATLVGCASPALLGVQVQTLAALAREVVERQGAPPDREDLFSILVRRSARREPALRAPLEDLADGYGAVRVGIDDLLDAGFAPAHAEVLDDALAAQGLGADSPERALLRVAGAVASALGAELASHRSQLFSRAREALERDAQAALPARAVAIYGFSDATGVQADLLVALVRGRAARVWLELPPDPACPQAPAREAPFGASLRERLRSAARSLVSVADAAPPRIEIWRARDPFDEARAVAGALRGRLDAGAVPERLAVVARDLAPYALALRRQLTALAIPFSGAGEPGPVCASGRRLAALVDLLREGGAVPAERWLETVWRLPESGARSGARGLAPGEGHHADLQHALHARGCSALRDVASLEPEVGALAAAATALLGRLAAWPASAALGLHAQWLAELTRDQLGWDAETPGSAELEALLAGAEALHAASLARDEFLDWLSHELAEAGRAPIGGAGGGVQLLSVMQARGLVFDHVYLLGLDRGVFPRPIREDPLLPDRVRRRLRDLLPDLPVKRDGFDEERFLFAQLLASSPSLTLSFSEWDAEGRPLAPSPLLDALARGPGAAKPQPAPAPALAAPRERACEAGLRASRDAFAAALEIALGASEIGAAAGIAAGALASARLAVLAELDAHGEARRLSGPYLGFVGRRGERDPRGGALAVTRLEGLARCAWQVFLERMLRLGAPRDARGALPEGGDARLLGNVVHAALESIAEGAPANGAALAALPAAEALALAWPDDRALDEILLRAARRVIRKEAIALESYAHALARRARAFVLQARADWRAGEPAVLGAEVKGSLSVTDAEGALREISFQADRVDRHGAGLRLTDYKSGKPPAKESRDPGRHAAELREKIAQGRLLQAAVYAAAAGAGGVGRYLYLAPDLPDAVREVVAPAGPEDRERLESVLRTLLSAWDAGAFVPRLRDPAKDQEPGSCRLCGVKDACLRGDSGVRLRLGAWAESAGEAPAERAALAVWRLPEVAP